MKTFFIHVVKLSGCLFLEKRVRLEMTLFFANN